MTFFSKTFLKIVLSSVLFASVNFATGTLVYAADAASFLKGLDGSFRGRGKATYADGKKSVNVSCQIANRLSSDGNDLTISGVCATTQGKAKVNGQLKLSDSKFSGTFFSPSATMKLTKSYGVMTGDALTMTSFFVDNSSGTLTRIKQVVQRTATGFSASISTYDNASKKYRTSGIIKFKKKK
ncbi:MAG: hypothetical protein JKX91_01630 [Rhizobiaceae bacterium]|nr:hypothetical protein [Rhizobiaceae bacterium]